MARGMDRTGLQVTNAPPAQGDQKGLSCTAGWVPRCQSAYYYKQVKLEFGILGPQRIV